VDRVQRSVGNPRSLAPADLAIRSEQGKALLPLRVDRQIRSEQGKALLPLKVDRQIHVLPTNADCQRFVGRDPL
jgi:hypothetical protein